MFSLFFYSNYYKKNSRQTKPFKMKISIAQMRKVSQYKGLFTPFHTMRSNQGGKQQGACIFQAGIRLELFTTKTEQLNFTVSK